MPSGPEPCSGQADQAVHADTGRVLHDGRAAHRGAHQENMLGAVGADASYRRSQIAPEGEPTPLGPVGFSVAAEIEANARVPAWFKVLM